MPSIFVSLETSPLLGKLSDRKYVKKLLEHDFSIVMHFGILMLNLFQRYYIRSYYWFILNKESTTKQWKPESHLSIIPLNQQTLTSQMNNK